MDSQLALLTQTHQTRPLGPPWHAALLQQYTRARGGGGRKKLPGTSVTLCFWGGTPGGGGGVRKKNRAKLFSTPAPLREGVLPHPRPPK